MKKDTPPPKWADHFFRWYCRSNLQEEILGDLYERFQKKKSAKGLIRARLWYWISVFRFINRYTLRPTNKQRSPIISPDMLRNYFKVGFRNMLKHKLSTLINALGMALAIGCCLIIFTFLDQLFHLDDIHQHRDEIYVAEHWISQHGERDLWSRIPEPLGPQIQEDFPQVQSMVRLNHNGAIVQRKEQVFREWISYVDPAFFELFDFPLKFGKISDFSDPTAVVLTDELATKYFGNENPVGQSIHFNFSTETQEKEEDLIVQAVLKKLPLNSSFRFGILLPFDKQRILGISDLQDWDRYADITFLHIPKSEDLALLNGKEQAYLQQLNAATEGWKADALHFQEWSSIAHRKEAVSYSQFSSAHIVAIFLLAIIAAGLLMLVCFNYMNIAIASAAGRLKEISVRKVMGGNRRQIIFQFLSENLLVCFMALVFGVLLAESFFQPWFNELIGVHSAIDYLGNWRLWLFIMLLVLLAAIGGAGYPAFYISAFHPVAIFKDTFRLSRKNRFRKGLLIGQFLLTFIAICAAIAFLKENKSLREKNWGYDQNSLLVLKLEYGENFDQLQAELLSQANILAVGGSKQQLGGPMKAIRAQVADQEYNFNTLEVGYQYLETLGIPLLRGRTFHQQRNAAGLETVIVNEALTRQLNWDDPIGKTIKIGTSNYQVIGETDNFHYYPFNEDIKPLVIKMAESTDLRYLSAKVAPNQLAAATKTVEKTWKDIHPNTPFDFFYQDGVFDNYFLGVNQLSKVFSATAFLSVIISIIGLFGLALLIIAQRMKEMSIRKILGASALQLSYRLNRDFMSAVVVASLLGAPLAYLLISFIFNILSADSSIQYLPFVITVLLLLSMPLASIVLHLYRLAVSDPSKYLREE